MLLLHALVLSLLGISAMATPIPGRVTGEDHKNHPLPAKLKFEFDSKKRGDADFSMSSGEIQHERLMMTRMRGLWRKVVDEKPYIIFQDANIPGVRMIHPESVEENQLGQIFSNTPWNFLTEGHAAALELKPKDEEEEAKKKELPLYSVSQIFHTGHPVAQTMTESDEAYFIYKHKEKTMTVSSPKWTDRQDYYVLHLVESEEAGAK